MDKRLSRKWLKTEMYKLLVAHSDFDAAERSCKMILKRQGILRINNSFYKDVYPLCVAAIVCYARPFYKKGPFGSISEKYARYSKNQYNLVHKRIIEARNTFMAHSNLTQRPIIVVQPGMTFSIDRSPSESHDHVWFKIAYKDLSHVIYSDMIIMIREIKERLNKRIEELSELLYKDAKFPDKPFSLTLDEGL